MKICIVDYQVIDYFELCNTNLVSDVARVVKLILEFLASKAGSFDFQKLLFPFILNTRKCIIPEKNLKSF